MTKRTRRNFADEAGTRGVGFSFITGTAAFRTLFAFQLVPTLIMLAGSCFVPESPRWYVLVGRYDEAVDTLKRLHENEVHDPNDYESEFGQIKAQVELDKQEQLGLVDIFRRPSYRRRVLLVMGFFVGQQ